MSLDVKVASFSMLCRMLARALIKSLTRSLIVTSCFITSWISLSTPLMLTLCIGIPLPKSSSGRRPNDPVSCSSEISSTDTGGIRTMFSSPSGLAFPALMSGCRTGDSSNEKSAGDMTLKCSSRNCNLFFCNHLQYSAISLYVVWRHLMISFRSSS